MPSHRIVEAYPLNIAKDSAEHQRQLTVASKFVTAVPEYVIVKAQRRWRPGQTIRIAFRGGNEKLYKSIEAAAVAWIAPGAANLNLNFKDSNNHYLTWSENDSNLRAEIRIAFESGKSGGYWSLIGTDSIDATHSGGRPNEASMNLESFDKGLPSDWQGIVRHEFGHALGFEHEHQSPIGGCDFRFDDDRGYIKSKDADGWFSLDKNGRYPGMYTYMGGKANYWSRKQVDENLRPLKTASAFNVGPFDKLSIMKYYYDPFMFTSGAKSKCFSPNENEVLSEQDLVGVRTYYPSDPIVADRIKTESFDTLSQLIGAKGVTSLFKASIRNRLNAIQLKE